MKDNASVTETTKDINCDMDITSEMITTTDGQEIYLRKWAPKTPTVQPIIIQLVHGMAEHIHRYDELARTLVKEGYIVYGNDHRGHGRTAKNPKDFGYFALKDGWDRVVQDLNEINYKIKKENPKGKVILFGHSMGSFLSRRYVQLFPDSIDALILSGTGYSNGAIGQVGIKLAGLCKKISGEKQPNKFLDKLAFGSFNSKFKPNKTNFDWLSRDEKAVQSYIDDPLCGFVFTTEGFYDLMGGIEMLHEKENIEKTPSSLPIYIFSGDKDPVGNYGKGVSKVLEKYKSLGIKDIECRLYEGGRHEMLNEINRQEVFQDIIDWIKKHEKY